MNKVHVAILKHIREENAKESGKIASTLSSLSDEQVVRMMFSNYRGRDRQARGLRLTNFGLEVMKCYFKFWEIQQPQGHTVVTQELLYLDRRATLPYYFNNEKVVVFEAELGIKLKLADGQISTLIEIEAF